MSSPLKSVIIERACLARLYSLCNHFAENDVSVQIKGNHLLFGGMNPKSSFELVIIVRPQKRLEQFEESVSKEPPQLNFIVSKCDFSANLQPFSKTGSSSKGPKFDSDKVIFEIYDNNIKLIQENLAHISNEVELKNVEGSWSPLPSEDWEISIIPDLLSDYINRMVVAMGSTVVFEKEGGSLFIISEGGRERIPITTTDKQNRNIRISKMTLNRLRPQLIDYDTLKIGIRNKFIILEGNWKKQVICKWKLDAIEESLDFK